MENFITSLIEIQNRLTRLAENDSIYRLLP